MTEDAILELAREIASWIAYGIDGLTDEEKYQRLIVIIRKHQEPWNP